MRVCENERVSQGLLSDLLDPDFRECEVLEFAGFQTVRNWRRHRLQSDLEKETAARSSQKGHFPDKSTLKNQKKVSVCIFASWTLDFALSALKASWLDAPLSARAKITFCGNHAVNYKQQVPPGWKVLYPPHTPLWNPPVPQLVWNHAVGCCAEKGPQYGDVGWN